MDVSFFRSEKAFHTWLQKNHAKSTALVVGSYKKDSGKPCITYPEARDQALCFGWIDGVRRALDNTNYTVRFTPRKQRHMEQYEHRTSRRVNQARTGDANRRKGLRSPRRQRSGI